MKLRLATHVYKTVAAVFSSTVCSSPQSYFSFFSCNSGDSRQLSQRQIYSQDFLRFFTFSLLVRHTVTLTGKENGEF